MTREHSAATLAAIWDVGETADRITFWGTFPQGRSTPECAGGRSETPLRSGHLDQARPSPTWGRSLMVHDRHIAHRAVMPVRSSDPLSPTYPEAWIRPWLRVALLLVVVPALAMLSLLLYIAVWSAVTGYWGPEWPNVWRDTVWITGLWLMGVACFIGLVTRPTRRWWATWKRHRVGNRSQA